MTRSFSRAIPLLSLFAALISPLLIVRATGGRIEGKVTDPKGAAVAGAAVSVTDLDTNQTFTGVTDGQGKYSLGGLAPGTYAVMISATGFSEGAATKLKLKRVRSRPLM